MGNLEPRNKVNWRRQQRRGAKKGVDKRYRYSDRIGVQDRGEGNKERGVEFVCLEWQGREKEKNRSELGRFPPFFASI